MERYIRTNSADDEQVKVTCLLVNKTSFVKKNEEDGRIVMLEEHRLDGKIIRASYSTRSNTVYLSLKSIPQAQADP
jgi:hypothetical protein